MNNTARTVWIACAFFCFGSLAACNEEKSVSTSQVTVTVKEKSKEIQVTSKDDSLRMQADDKSGHIMVKNQDGKDVEMTYANGRLVDGFPKDIPIFVPAAVTMSQVMNKQQAAAMFSTKSDPEAVRAFYKSAIAQNGWILENETDISGMVLLQGKKGAAHLIVEISEQGDETAITVTMSDE